MANPLIKLGSNGEYVRQWQRIIGVPESGNFDANTDSATKAWQSSHQLVPDGKVGPLTWAAGLGQPAPAVTKPTGNQNADVSAYELAKRALPSATEAERQYAVAVSRGEGGYGAGWGHPSAKTIEVSQKFGLTGYEGKGSNNFGAEQGEGDAGSFPHVDYHANGKPYVGKYKKHSSPEQGFKVFASILLKPNVKAAVNAGDLKGAVFAQHSNGYFELDPNQYFAAVQRNYEALSVNTGWQRLLGAAAVAHAAVSGGIMLLGAAALMGGLLWWKLKS